MENITKKTIVCFHIGRGGRFNNSGFKSFVSFKDINEALSFDDNKNCNSIQYENENKYYKALKKYPNLLEKFEECRDNDDFTWFEEKFSWDFGEKIYTDSDGNSLGVKLDNDGTGLINRDYDYDTTYCQYVEDCDDEELHLIYNYSGYVNTSIFIEVKNEMKDRGLLD